MALNDTAINALRPKKKRYDVTDRDGLLLEHDALTIVRDNSAGAPGN